MSLLKAQPQRIASAVLAQPIGRVGAMKPGRAARFDAWAKSLGADHPEATEPVLDAFYSTFRTARSPSIRKAPPTPASIVPGRRSPWALAPGTGRRTAGPDRWW
jgi:hypothetical protein